jgi:DNA-directed RNA polymerase subunit L
MRPWEHLVFTTLWDTIAGDDKIRVWQYTIDPPRDGYAEILVRCNENQRPVDIWTKLGEEGWELVAVTHPRRDQFSRAYKVQQERTCRFTVSRPKPTITSSEK